MLATLAFAGLRIGELLALRWRDVDLAGTWITVADSKTDAGVRKVKMRAALRDVSTALKPVDADPDAYVFATRTGGNGLRGPFASLLCAIGETPPIVMQEMGHTDSKLALNIYAHALRREPGENERMRALVDGESFGSSAAPRKSSQLASQ